MSPNLAAGCSHTDLFEPDVPTQTCLNSASNKPEALLARAWLPSQKKADSKSNVSRTWPIWAFLPAEVLQTDKWWFSLFLPLPEDPHCSVLALSVSDAVELTNNENQDEDHIQAVSTHHLPWLAWPVGPLSTCQQTCAPGGCWMEGSWSLSARGGTHRALTGEVPL